MTTPTTRDGDSEPLVTWPTARLVMVTAGVPVLCGAIWALCGRLGGGPGIAPAGAAGAALVGVFSLAGALAVAPWKARRLSTWASIWMGGSVARLVLLPLATALLYSATSFGLAVLALAVGLTCFLTLLAEAVVVALHVRRAV